MGGLLRAPKPAPAPAPTPDPAVAALAAAAPPPAPSPEAVAAAARREATDRARRGLAGTVATSARGVLDPLPYPGRKTLLGE